VYYNVNLLAENAREKRVLIGADSVEGYHEDTKRERVDRLLLWFRRSRTRRVAAEPARPLQPASRGARYIHNAPPWNPGTVRGLLAHGVEVQ
jgi:hypothetical protein